MVLHPVEGVLARPVTGLQQDRTLGVGAGVRDQLLVDVAAFGLVAGDGGLVGEENAADRALFLRLWSRGDDRQPGEEQIALRQPQPPRGLAEMGHVAGGVHRDHVGAVPVQVSRGDLLDDDADPAGDQHRAGPAAPRDDGGQLNAQPLGERTREAGDDDIGLQRLGDHLLPAHGLHRGDTGVGDLLRGKRGANAGNDDPAGESAGFQFPVDTGAPFQLRIESGHQ